MLDYDFLCDREPSIKAIFVRDIHPKKTKVFFGDKEIFIPQINQRNDVEYHKNHEILINLASERSAGKIIQEALQTWYFQAIFTVAEWIPERESRQLLALSKKTSTQLFWPSIVGGIVAWVIRIGNTWGSLENLVKSRLYQQGTVAIVSKSGGMMNELCRIVSKYTDGVHTALQIGGDRYPMTSFEDIILWYQKNPEISMIVMLGEVGNTEELVIAEYIKNGTITKPVVARCSGTVASSIKTDIQFGHAWARASTHIETAIYKNQVLRDAGAFVPDDFAWFANVLANTFQSLWKDISRDINTPLHIQKKLTIIKQRKKTLLTSTISDERWEELLYNGIPVSDFVATGGIGRVIGHLWLKRELPWYVCKLIETIIILLADHGPAVSGAMNTIITARAWKNITESIVAWLLTIWPKFGGAITDAADFWYKGVQSNKNPFDRMQEQQQLRGPIIPGIGHRIKSIYNPDTRVTLLFEAMRGCSVQRYLDFAKSVAAITTQKKPNLILNVDGAIAAVLLDVFVDIGMKDVEIQQAIDSWMFNGFFVLARTIGFIGHYVDQMRLQEGLFRMPWDEIMYWD